MDETAKSLIISEIKENRAEIKKLYQIQTTCKLKTQDDINKLRLSIFKIVLLLLASGMMGGTASTVLTGIIK